MKVRRKIPKPKGKITERMTDAAAKVLAGTRPVWMIAEIAVAQAKQVLSNAVLRTGILIWKTGASSEMVKARPVPATRMSVNLKPFTSKWQMTLKSQPSWPVF